MARLTAAKRKALPKSAFAGPPKKGKAGKGSFPMNDKAHARKAVQMEKYASPATRAKINSRARAMGIKVGGK